MKKVKLLSPLIILCLILLIGFLARLYMLNRQIADWHSWRQADTAAVARIFYEEGYNPLYPQGFDMTPVSDNHQVNLNRYRFVEFPIYSTVAFLGYELFGFDVRVIRMVSVLFSLGSLIFIYLITKRYSGTLAGLIAALLFAILPFNVYFSRTTLPEPTMIFFALGALYFTDRWIWENTAKLFVLSFIFIACALLMKPMAGFFLIPLLYSFWKKEGKIWPIPFRYIVLTAISVASFIGWRLWMNQFPEGIPSSSWLLNGNGIRFRPAFWRWIFQDRLGREILTVPGMMVLGFGIIRKPWVKNGYFLHILLASMFLYLIVFATGNVQHDYYQVMIVPSLVIIMGVGLAWLVKGGTDILPRFFSIPLVFFLVSLMMILTWYEDRGFYQINNDAVVEGGEVANQILPKDAVVLAPNGGDSTLLYHVNRPGFSVKIDSLENLIQKYHVSYMVSLAQDSDTNEAMQKYTVIKQTPKYIIIDLTHQKS